MWPEVALTELGYVSRGKSKHRPRNDPSLYGGPYPFIQTAEVKAADLWITNHTQTYSEKGLAQSRIWPENTLCITIAANIADTALLSYPVCFPDSIIGFIADESKCDVRFVKYHFDIVQEHMRMVSHGTTQDNLSQDKLLRFTIPCPPLDTQRKIGDLLSSYGALIESNQRRIALLEESTRLLYREWFMNLRFPGYESVLLNAGVPQGWSKVPIAEQTTFLNRGITPAYDDTAQGLVINQKCIRDGRLSMSPARKQSKEVKPERLIQLGDVLINSTGAGTLGRVAQVRSPVENCTVDTHVTIARPIGKEWATYFGQVLLNLEPTFSAMGKGATNQLELNRADIAAIEIWRPDVTVVQDFHEMVWPMLAQAENLLSANQKLAEARNALLPKLMSGEIQV